ncbi:hypothetical protein [Hyalangium versicolor]|uniref:hypothetical protein n=1 Tax=Hyalangium versicolor TaxID=2861190 RepID=UPI001CCB7849|nr:hypothetical protein [Hyalangium versicolor]
MRQGIRRADHLPPCCALGVLLTLGALPAGATTLTAEVSATQDSRALTLLGDVELSKETTFLTFGYSGLRPQPDTAASHQLSAGLDHAFNLHWLVSGSLLVGLPKTTNTPLAQERPRLGLPALAARTSYNSQGLSLTAGYDSGGFSDLEYGFDVGVGLTRYPLRRALVARQGTSTPTVEFQHEEHLGVLRPSLGVRLLPGTSWEIGLRGSVYLYSEDPLSAGQFTEEEQKALATRYAQAGEDRVLQREFLKRLYRDLGTSVAGRLTEVNAMSGLPSAPARFDVKPSVSYRFSSRVRGQLSYVFTQYVTGQGLSHVLSARCTIRLGEPIRVWAAAALQTDVPEDEAALHTGLATLGMEYTF